MYLPNPDEHPTLPRTVFSAGAGAPLARAPLAGALTADAVIIGGGFVGVSAALHLAEAGRPVVLVEANEIGWGSAGRNAGHVSPDATKLGPRRLAEVYGPVYGPRLAAVGAGAPQFVTDLARRLGIDVAVVRGGILTAAHSAAAARRLEADIRFLDGSGAPVEFLPAAAVEALFGTRTYFGARLDRRGIAINPLAFVRGMARAAIARGALVHERSPMRKLVRTGDGWEVVTDGGSVRAGHVLLCTNAYTDDRCWPGLRRSIVPVRLYLGWTRPLPAALRAEILPGIAAMLDTRHLPVAMRLHGDGRLQFGAGRPGFGPEQEPAARAYLDQIKRIMPALAPAEIEGWWSGWVTRGIADGWRLHELAPGLVTAIGCNGRGVAMGPIMGRELARYVGGTPAADLIVPLSPVRGIPWYSFHQPLGRAAIGVFGLLDRLETRN